MEWDWGTIANWPAQSAEEWRTMKERDSECVTVWLNEGGKKVAAGRCMLAYLGRVMEGQLPTDVEALRDLYLQGHQLTCTFHSAIIGLEQTLNTVRSEIQAHDGCNCSCGNVVCA